MLERCGSATLVAVFCAAVLLTRSCRGVSGEDEEVLEEKQLVVLNRKGLFILESILLKRCIKADHSSLVLEDCQRPTRRMLWKWVSSHRLYNLGTGMCLGLDILNTTHPLGMFECDKAYTMMWWRCRGNTLYGAFQWKVTGAGRLVVVKKSDYYEWKRHRTPREGPCSYPYEDIHTLLGNANGMPCVFPFNYNNKWYSECTTEGREDNLHWCSTTPRYDRDERWGFCPVKDSSCERFWESNQELQACYQFNLYTILTWSQALATCQAQGGNLLSITSMAEQKYIRDRLSSVGTMVWIGLNHLKEGQGWQWSDGAPLSLVNFIPALPASPLQVNRECGVYNSAYDENWQSLSCESALPYICKKMPNDTRRAEPLENWQYIHTKCDDGWWPHNGFCYRVLPDSEAGSWQMSSEACSSQGANLTSIHSLSELEMLLFLLANVSGENLEVWIGLWKPLSSPAVEWSDGSPVTLTLWQQFQPVHNLTETPLCAKLEKKMDTKTFYSARPRVPLALVPENPHDSDADLDDSDDDPTKDPDYQPTHAESTGDSSFETLDEEESPSTSRSSAQPSHKKSRKRKRKLKTILLEETGDSPDSRPPSDPSKSTRRIWKHEDIEEFKVPDPRFEPPEDVHTPFQYFKMLFTDEMIEHIAYHTNLYSAQKLGDPIKTSTEEIEDFLAILLYMGVFTFPSLEDYWHQESRFNIIADIMPRKRFQLLRRYIHFCDNQQINESPDRFYKIRPLFEMLRHQCLLIPSTFKHSVDEVMVAYKGTMAGTLRQYIANKPDKWGFKLFCRASSSGIIHDLMLYQGISTFFNVALTEQEQMLPLGAKVVTTLCKTIKHPELSVVFFDNFFTSFGLIQSLYSSLGVRCIGTVRPNRTGGAPLMADKDLVKHGRGASDYRSAEGVIAVKWFDNKCVNLLSNASGIMPLSTVRRWSKESKAKTSIPCPSLIPAYNEHMGGIDLSDMLVHLYKTPAKSRRWYLPLFGYIIDLCVTNSWLVYKRDCDLLKQKPMSLKKFRLAVAHSLNKINKQAPKVGRPSLSSPPQMWKGHTPRPPRPKPQPDVRYDNMGHWPLHCDKRGRCNVCPKGVSRWRCQKCDVFLCLNSNQECFVKYHQK